MTCSACYGENQGRGCLVCMNATRRVLGMREVNGAMFPVEAEPMEGEWDREQAERPMEAGDGAVLAVIFLGILFLFGVPLFVELVLR